MARPKVDVQRREEILIAFESCLMQHGAAKVTLQKVANEANLPRSLVRYFVGNRDNMVSLLIDRIIGKAELQLEELQRDSQNTNLSQLVDYIFDVAFFDDTNNRVIDSLWELAQDDSAVTHSLINLYQHLQTTLVNTMQEENRGKNSQQREATAFAILSMAYGDASFRALGLSPVKLNQIKKNAQLLLNHL